MVKAVAAVTAVKAAAAGDARPDRTYDAGPDRMHAAGPDRMHDARPDRVQDAGPDPAQPSRTGPDADGAIAALLRATTESAAGVRGPAAIRVAAGASSVAVCGIDEAGRGPLAGPVHAAAVVLDPLRPLAGLRDSKKLSAATRARLAVEIRMHALDWAIASASVDEIDAHDILGATLLAMRRACDALTLRPALARVDGNRAPTLGCAVQTVVGGDDSDPAIAAASILAKVARDTLMLAFDREWPQYGFARHKGYGTREHLQALRRDGPCAAHRRSFAPVRQAGLFDAGRMMHRPASPALPGDGTDSGRPGDGRRSGP